jgi:2-dehydropantoate 2-reductase
MDVIHIVGAGGIGCATAYALRTAGVSVILVDTHSGKLEWGRSHGVAVDNRPPLPVDFVSFDSWTPDANSVVLLCTKCYDNAAVLNRLPPSVTLIPIQNGFDAQLEAWDHALEGIASFVSECDRERPHTRITRKGCLHFGPRVKESKSHPSAAKLVDAFRRGGLFAVKEVPAIQPYKYTKLLYNAAVSPLAAAAGLDNGQLLSLPEARRLFFTLIQENYAILSGSGIDLGKIGPFHPATVAAILRRRWLARALAWAFEPSLRGTYCSMAPDLPRGRTEIDYYNQRLVQLAGDRPCPLNRAVVDLIKRMERERIQPHREALRELMPLAL